MPPKDSAPPRDKILFVDLGSHFGGVEVYIEGLAEILGQNCEMHAVSSLGKLTGNLRRKKVRVYSFTRIGSKWLKPLRLALAMVFVPWLVFHYQIRTVQVNGYFESALLLPLRLLRRKTIYTMHGPFETDRYAWYRNPARYFPRVMSKYCLQFASVVVCVSGAVAQVARGALPPHKLIVIPNWVHLPPLPAVKTKPAHIVQLLYVGRLEQYKGVHLIIQAMRELIDAELHIVGEGTYRAELEKLSIGVPIQFHGFQSDPSRFYSNADIFINPSLGPEGLPIVSLEAMSYGCLLYTSRCV